MGVKPKELDLSAFDSAVKTPQKKNGNDLDLSVFDSTVKKKEGGDSGDGSQSISPSNSFLRSQQTGATPLQSNFREGNDQEDLSGIESSLKDLRTKYDAIQDAKIAQTQSSATPGGFLPSNSQLSGALVKKANDEYDAAKKSNSELLKQNASTIYKPVKELFDNGKWKDFFDNQGNFKYGEASAYLDGVVKAKGGGQYLRDQLVYALKQEGQYKLDEPLREKYRDEEYKKAGIDISKYGQSLVSKMTAAQQNNIDLLETETKQKSDQLLNTNIKPQAVSIGTEYQNKVNELSKQIESGQISQEEAKNLLTVAGKEYQAKLAALNKHYQDGVRDINTKAQNKFARINKERNAILSGITDEDVFKSIPAEEQKKIYDANARVEARIQNDKNQSKKAEDLAAANIPGSFGTGLFAKSVINGWYSGLSNLGQYLGMKGIDNGLSDYLKSKLYDSDVFQTAQYDYGHGETINRLITGTGSSLGASAPIMAPAIGVSLTSGGLGLPEVATSLLTGLTSYYGEKAQNTGEVYKDVLEQTGDSKKAYEAASRYEQKQLVMAPLYFMEGAGIHNLIQGKGVKQLLIGQAQELAQELPTEYWQNYTQAQEEQGYQKGFGDYIKENPETALDVIASTIGQGGIMSAGGKLLQSINSLIPHPQSQYAMDMVQKHGVNFALENLQKQFNTGVIDEATFQQQKETIARAASKINQLAAVGIKDEAAKNYTVLSDTANQLADNIKKSEDEGMKIVYEKKLEETHQQMEAAAGGHENYVVFKMPGGADATKVVPIQQVESMRKSGMLDQLIQMSDGIEVKGNEAIHNELQQRKRELGNPANAPEGMYNDIEEKDVDEAPKEAERPIMDRVKEYGGEGILRTLNAHEVEGKHEDAMQFLKEQSLDAPNALKKQLGMRKNLTTDIIAENSPTEIDEALRKYEEKALKEINNKSENKDPRVLKEIEQHISLLEQGLEKANNRLSGGENTEREVAPVAEENKQAAEPTGEVKGIESDRQKELFQAHKPNISMEFVSNKDLVKSDDPILNKETNDKIKSKFDNLQKLIDCIWG